MRISCTLLLMMAYMWPDVASKHLPSGVQENTITQEMLLDKLDCNYCSLSPYTEFITFDRICECKGEYLFVGAFNLDNSEKLFPILLGPSESGLISVLVLEWQELQNLMECSG
jgi:hypothetical protein